MKRIISSILIAALILGPISTAYARQCKDPRDRDKKLKQTEAHFYTGKKQAFKLSGKALFKYGKYKLPQAPVTKGMGAQASYNQKKSVLTVSKGTTTIVIDFLKKEVKVNGISDPSSGIFKAKNSMKTVVLLQYIARVLGIQVDVKDGDVIVVTPGLDAPTKVTITPVGTAVVANTLNATTTHMLASAEIKAGQATGGKAELYVGSKLVAVDAMIHATDTSVTFSTSDQTPTNEELRAIVPAGGLVTVKLYNAAGQAVVSTKGNPTLTVDYNPPTLSSITSALYFAADGKIYITATGAGEVGDMLDVTRFTFLSPVNGSYYQLTNTEGAGSVGSISSENLLIITLGSKDKQVLSSMGGTSLTMLVTPGPLLKDTAGNSFGGFSAALSIPVTVYR